MKLLSPTTDRLTANETAAIKAIRAAGLSSGKVGRTEYFMRQEGPDVWIVTIRKVVPKVHPLRKEQRTLKIEI